MTLPKAYCAGPMTGIPMFNFEAFDAAKAEVRLLGYEPISPADLDRAAGFDPMSLPPDWDWYKLPDTFDMQAAFDRDVAAIKAADAIYMLCGWERSTGATAEYHLARWLRKTILYQSKPVTVLDEAARLTSVDRQRVYGHPSVDLDRTAKLWTAYLDGRHELTGRDVCWLMVLLKSSRDRNTPHRDALIDGCGYLRCAEMLEE